MKSLRADKLLVENGLVSTRAKAQGLIKEGVVFSNNEQVLKVSQILSFDDIIEIRKEQQYVGRGAQKLEGASKDLQLVFKNKIIADIGASTGGFSEYALKHGAHKVYAIDVGRGQLDPSLLNREDLINYEGVNIRDGIELPEAVDMAVVDLSFISLRLCLLEIIKLVKNEGEIVALFKPQFEVGRNGLNSKGIVKNKQLIDDALEDFQFWCQTMNVQITNFVKCRLQGKTGNQEYFFYFKKT